jgi:hypothetical protein
MGRSITPYMGNRSWCRILWRSDRQETSSFGTTSTCIVPNVRGEADLILAVACQRVTFPP